MFWSQIEQAIGPLMHAHVVRQQVLNASYSLCCDLDELFDELDPLAEQRTQQHLGHHPQLDLVAALQQQLQRHGPAAAATTTAAAAVAAEGEIDEFLLHNTRRAQS